jgi:hypothetical protein
MHSFLHMPDVVFRQHYRLKLTSWLQEDPLFLPPFLLFWRDMQCSCLLNLSRSTRFRFRPLSPLCFAQQTPQELADSIAVRQPALPKNHSSNRSRNRGGPVYPQLVRHLPASVVPVVEESCAEDRLGQVREEIVRYCTRIMSTYRDEGGREEDHGKQSNCLHDAVVLARHVVESLL